MSDSAPADTELLKFLPFNSSVDVSFWFELAKKKLDVFRLDETAIPISGYYGLSTTSDQPARFNLDSDAFKSDFTPSKNHFACPGHIHNKNTLESFKSLDKNNLISSVGDEIWNRIESGKLSNLNPFFLLTYADLKKYTFSYWFAFPALVHPKDHFRLLNRTPISTLFSTNQISSLVRESSSHFEKGQGYFLIKTEGDQIITADIDSFDNFYNAENSYVVVASQSGNGGSSWILRNLLAALKVSKKLSSVKVLQYKCDRFDFQNIGASDVIEVDLIKSTAWSRSDVSFSGWERNSKGKLAPRSINLSSSMDQKKLASNAVDLNLKLMRWRLLPNLKLEEVAQTKCLLFGAGTLGCNVARNLLAWGVRHITFVDNGKVSFSNPVRQTLYTFDDSAQGLPKAETAAQRLKQIFPEVTTRGVELTIPMPGHLVQSQEEKDTAIAHIKTIEDLIDEHDVSFLLLDSRESRWLPTMISEAKGKPVITTALGFDNFVVLRHGVHHNRDGSKRISTHHEKTQNSHINQNVSLGCYFCNDVVAPQDSARDRTLDQQCTVTRPGLSSMASSSAVELLVTMLHHPLKEQAPGDPKTDIGADTPTELGIVPHQIRGYLSFFSNMIITGHRYDKCVACSDPVVEEYQNKGNDFLLEVFNNPKLLEDITGITAMKEEEHEQIDESWDTEDSDLELGSKNDLDDF